MDPVNVCCRLRPPNARELGAGALRRCVEVTGPTTLRFNAQPEPRDFAFDWVGDEEASQAEVFDAVCRPITLAVLEGYNGTVFAYGQTGSGKTHTILGGEGHEERGLVPRAFDLLFASIQRLAGEVLCRCSFLEIYNERVFDLLDPASSGGLQLRESLTHGVYVEGLTEETVTSAADAIEVMNRGAVNRRVGETAMNRESSRSHSVLSMVVESREETDGGLLRARSSRFNLIDLAGSERQRDSHAEGERLKEASSINKSLSALGNVILALTDVAKGRERYIHYRDSKLTFLLKDSLGGNSKTVIVATLSPSDACFSETLGTLKFAQRAKLVQNRAVINEDTSGSVEELRRQVKLLTAQLTRASAAADATRVLSVSSSSAPSEDGEGEMLTRALREASHARARATAADESAREMEGVVASKHKELMAAKLVLRLREANLERLRVDVEADDDETEALKAEVEALREQAALPSEAAVHWRLRSDELQQALDQLRADMGPDPVVGGCHSRTELERLNSDLSEKILSLSEQLQVAQASQGSAVEQFRAEEATRKAEEALVEAKAKATRAEAEAAEARDLAESSIQAAEENFAEAQAVKAELARSEALRAAMAAQKDSESGVELELKARLATACKETAVLHQEGTALRTVKAGLEQSLADSQAELEATQALGRAELQAAREETQRIAAELLAARQHQQRAEELEQQLRAKRREADRVTFELANLQEDHDTLVDQCTYQRVRLAQLDLQAQQWAEAEAQRSAAEDEERSLVQVLRDEISAYQTQASQLREEVAVICELRATVGDQQAVICQLQEAGRDSAALQEELQAAVTRAATAEGDARSVMLELEAQAAKTREAEAQVRALREEMALSRERATEREALEGSQARVRALQEENEALTETVRELGQLRVENERLAGLQGQAHAALTDALADAATARAEVASKVGELRRRREAEEALVAQEAEVRGQLEQLRATSAAGRKELEQLRTENARLAGHQNHQQKIQHHLKIKNENNQLRDEVCALKSALQRANSHGPSAVSSNSNNCNDDGGDSGASAPESDKHKDKENRGPQIPAPLRDAVLAVLGTSAAPPLDTSDAIQRLCALAAQTQADVHTKQERIEQLEEQLLDDTY